MVHSQTLCFIFPPTRHKDSDLKSRPTVSLCPGECVLIFELNLLHTRGDSLMSLQAELWRAGPTLWLCGEMFCLVALWTTTDRRKSTVHTSAALRGDTRAATWGEKMSHGGFSARHTNAERLSDLYFHLKKRFFSSPEGSVKNRTEPGRVTTLPNRTSITSNCSSQ